jgi:hypothetical protein
MSNHPGVFFYLNASPWDRSRVEPWSPEAIDHPPAGVLLVWDPEFCVRNSDPRLVAPLERLGRAGWVDDPKAESGSGVNGVEVAPASSSLNSIVTWHILVSSIEPTRMTIQR